MEDQYAECREQEYDGRDADCDEKMEAMANYDEYE